MPIAFIALFAGLSLVDKELSDLSIEILRNRFVFRFATPYFGFNT